MGVYQRSGVTLKRWLKPKAGRLLGKIWEGFIAMLTVCLYKFCEYQALVSKCSNKIRQKKNDISIIYLFN